LYPAATLRIHFGIVHRVIGGANYILRAAVLLRRRTEGAGQGQCGPGQQVPDAELGKRIPALGRIRETARRDKRVRFTALLHHVTVDLLHWSFYQLKRQAAAGVDGVTWDQYEDGLESNLIGLCGRVHRGA
jgi:hypothetical protein